MDKTAECKAEGSTGPTTQKQCEGELNCCFDASSKKCYQRPKMTGLRHFDYFFKRNY